MAPQRKLHGIGSAVRASDNVLCQHATHRQRTVSGPKKGQNDPIVGFPGNVDRCHARFVDSRRIGAALKQQRHAAAMVPRRSKVQRRVQRLPKPTTPMTRIERFHNKQKHAQTKCVTMTLRVHVAQQCARPAARTSPFRTDTTAPASSRMRTMSSNPPRAAM